MDQLPNLELLPKEDMIKLSSILYLFYNTDLIDKCNKASDVMSTGYIDDVGILAWGKTTEQTCETLDRILKKAQR